MLVTGSSEVSNALSNYTISNSLRFQRASSQYLVRTPATNTNRKTWTWSGWVKRGEITYATATLFDGNDSAANRLRLYFENDNKLYLEQVTASTGSFNVGTVAVFRDPSSWYHIVCVFDTTQATSTDRIKIYINGVQQTLTGTYPSLNFDGFVNSTNAHTLGKLVSEYFDGYMAEINFIDGQALTPALFGATNPYTGQWQAQKYTGTYGTNGFYLPFSNGTSTTTLGADSSGNNNNWTLTNFTRSAGVSDCWMVDVPSGNGTGPATQPSSNYCVFNPVINNAGSVSYINGNLTASYSASVDRTNIGTISANTGKYYWEVTIAGISASSDFGVGLCKQTQVTNSWTAGGGPNVIYYGTGSGWNAYGVNSGGATGTFANGNVIGVAVDFDSNVISIYQNNTLLTSKSGVIDTTVGHTLFVNSYRSGSTLNLNCGQRSFAYTPPSGFVALCTANLPASTAPIVAGNKFMDALLWTGNGATTRTISGYNFTPDFIWTKNRSAPTTGTTSHWLYDSVRGAGSNALLTLESDTTSAEFDSKGTQGNATAFTSNGITFTQGSTANNNRNENNVTYVAWGWKAGGTPATTNTDGSIASVVSVNRNSGFSIVTYTGNGVNSTIGHGLGVAPKMVIVKNRNNAGLNWRVQHTSLSSGTSYLSLNLTDAQLSSATIFTAFPTATVINVGTDNSVNGSTHLMLAYCFAEIAGFSKFGSYTGNGSTDGPFIYCGFRPKYVMIKRTDVANDWTVHDAARNPYNAVNYDLYPNLSNAETVVGDRLDFVSNGFKLRTTGVYANASGGTYIYMAFAENPFQYANAR